MQPGQQQVDPEVGPQHHDEPRDAEPRGDQRLVLRPEPDVDHDQVDDPGDQSPGLLGVERPPPAPRVVRPPRAQQDAHAKESLASTKKLSDVDMNEYDAIFYPGGHGPLWDLVNDDKSIALIKTAYEQDKVIGAVCHAPAVFKNVEVKPGQNIVGGREVTGFTNSEEDAVGLSGVVPFLLEDMLKENTATYTRGDDWAPHIVVDGKLITGQNPASSEGAAKAVVQALQEA